MQITQHVFGALGCIEITQNEEMAVVRLPCLDLSILVFVYKLSIYTRAKSDHGKKVFSMFNLRESDHKKTDNSKPSQHQ